MSRSLAKITRLGVLSREIRSDYDSLQQLLERTRQNCNQVVTETILLGTKLTEAKQLVGHGNWIEWLAKHCPQIAETTARNYMRLANRQHIADLNYCKSLRQAYIAVGIIPTDEESKPTPAIEVTQQPVARLNSADDCAPPVIEATVVEPAPVASQPPAVEALAIDTPPETPMTRIKGKVDELMACLKPLNLACRKKAAVHLKPVIVFYHRFHR